MQSDYPLTRHFTKLVNTSTECLTRVVVTQTVNVPLEVWMTFSFTLVIAAVLVTGGVYLTYHGATNNVTDFIVLGSCGSFVGVCFGSVGMIILYKSSCGSGKQISWKNTLTQIQSKQDTMLLNFSDPPARPTRLQITNQLASHVNNAETSKHKSGSKHKSLSANNTVSGNAPAKSAPSCETLKSNQPTILTQTNDRRECIPTKNDSLIVNQGSVKKAEMSPDPIPFVFPKFRSRASFSSQTISSDVSSDSVQTFGESVTVVVAEVHAQPSFERDLSEFANEEQPEDESISESPLPNSLGALYNVDVVETLEDASIGDTSSRSNTGSRGSVSEEDIPFALDDQNIIYRLNTSDVGSYDDSLARLLINDPLIYGHTSDARHGYILNKCHAITEVLVHSG